MLQIERKAKHALQNELDALLAQAQAKATQRRHTQLGPPQGLNSPDMLKSLQDRYDSSQFAQDSWPCFTLCIMVCIPA